jgi:para-nitrobenzyl esterase
VGPLRWRAPQPVAPWSGVRDALAFGPDVPQPPFGATRAPRQDEDALYLNVWTPAVAPTKPLPVLVWIFGGGFMGGSGADPVYDGARLADEGAVVVTINYRCGLFGFLAHPALAAESEHGVSGNHGLLDQLAALRWVQANIACFGGDPGRVTAFGFSAGSASIALLLTSPHARGLFHRAILQSPGAGRPLATLEQAQQAGLAALGPELPALRSLSTAEVLARTGLLSPKVRALTRPRVLRPIQDGWLLPHDERTAWREGHVQRMPLLVGSNVDEGTVLTQAWQVDSVEAWRAQVADNFAGMAAEAQALYPAATDAQARAAVVAMFADTQFNFGTRMLARGMARMEPRTWKYLFVRKRPGQADGPHHGAEVGHVFGNLGAEGLPFDADDEALSQTVRRAWVAFARNGQPGVPGWAPYRVAEDNHLALGERLAPEGGWRREQLDLIERYYERRA